MREPGLGTLQHCYVAPYTTLVRLGQWDEILKEPPPASDLRYPLAMWHYARGMAFTRKGKQEEANRELANPVETAQEPALQKVAVWDLNRASDLTAIAADLRKNMENPRSLFGLAESLEAQGESERGKDVQKRFRRAWARADRDLARSAF